MQVDTFNSSFGLLPLSCILDDPSPPKTKWPWPSVWDQCDAILDAHFPGVQLSLQWSLEDPRVWMYVNQENNALRRTCDKIYTEAIDAQIKSSSLSVPTEHHFQDDSYVRVEWWREENVEERLFPYSLLSDIIYTVWSWTIDRDVQSPLWISIHDIRGGPAMSIRLGTISVIRDRWGPRRPGGNNCTSFELGQGIEVA